MSNLLLIYGKKEPTNIMLSDFFSSLAKCQCEFHFRFIKAAEVKERDIQWSDIVMGVRTQNLLEAEILAVSSYAGRITVEFIDDDFLVMKDYHLRRPLQEKALRLALLSSCIVMGFNKELCTKLCKTQGIGRYVHVDTAIEPMMMNMYSDFGEDEIRIVYYSSSGESNDYDDFIRPILPELYHKRGGRHIKWHFFSVHPDLSDTPFADSVTYYPSMGLDEFRNHLKEGHFSIGIQPIHGDTFTEGKYVNKFFEYSMAGIPGIYSNVKPYKGFINDGWDGILSDNLPEGWLQAFESMMNRKLRKEIVENAQERLRTEFSEQTICEKLIKDFPELLHYHANTSKIAGFRAARFRNRMSLLLDPFLRAVGRLRAEGMCSVITYTYKKYFKRKEK